MPRVLRPLKNGGFSYCSSPDHLVGKGRCNHLPGISYKQTKNEDGFDCVEISSLDDSDQTNIPKSLVKEDDLNEYVRNLDSQLEAEKKKKIIEFFNKYGK